MKVNTLVRSLAAGSVIWFGMQNAAFAATEIQFWHAMEAALGDKVNAIADQFNASQSDYKIVPVYKGTYDQSAGRGHRRLPHRQRAGHPAGL